MASSSQIKICDVWQYNLDEALDCIEQSIKSSHTDTIYRFISIDTEFPGTIHHLPIPNQAYTCLPPTQYYLWVKENVNKTHLIQLGLTLSDTKNNHLVWQFNFREFNPKIHPNNPESIALLAKQGIDFEENQKNGIDSMEFAYKFKDLLQKVSNPGSREPKLTWITFQGSNDFGFLMKSLYGGKLQEDLSSFTGLIGMDFGRRLYDMKLIAQSLRMHGGLERVANGLGLNRVAGKNHQAGSDSLLIMQVFMAVRKSYPLKAFKNKLFGLGDLNAKDTGVQVEGYRVCPPTCVLNRAFVSYE